MHLSKENNGLFIFAIVACLTMMAEESGNCTLMPMPVKESDFGEPDWEAILELAFPTWKILGKSKGCPRLDAFGGDLVFG